jgi:hypothetical protein
MRRFGAHPFLAEMVVPPLLKESRLYLVAPLSLFLPCRPESGIFEA